MAPIPPKGTSRRASRPRAAGMEARMTGKAGDEIARDYKAATRSPMPAATPPRITATSIPPSTTPRPCSIRAPRNTSRIAAATSTGGAARRPRRPSRTRSRRSRARSAKALHCCRPGSAAISTALLSVLRAGDHLLMTDSAYFPTRKLCDDILPRYGIATTYYDPAIGPGIAALIEAQHPRRLRRELRDR